MEELKEKIDKLEYAKKAVMSCLEDMDVSVDFKGIKFWAGEVERLRKEIKELL